MRRILSQANALFSLDFLQQKIQYYQGTKYLKIPLDARLVLCYYL